MMSNSLSVSSAPSDLEEKKRLRRRLSPFSVWCFAFGCLIGWGAFVMPGTTFLKRAGPLGSMFAIEMGAFIMLMISYNYFYMLQKFPNDGGQFMYASRAFGKGHGFLCAWFLGLCYLSIIPLNATSLQILWRTLFDDLLQFGFHYTVMDYEMYMGELILAIGTIILVALITLLGIHLVGKIQVTLVVFYWIAVLIILAGALINPGKVLHEDLGPLFNPHSSIGLFLQMFSVVAIAPWAFVGFEIVPQLSLESNFSTNDGKVIMDTCIICGAFSYISLALMAALAIPVGYSTWAEYIYGLPYLRGMASVPTAFGAHKLLGTTGSILWGLSALSAILTTMIGFYIATSRLLYSMSMNGMLPSWFSHLSRHGIPINATLFCMAISMVTPLLGRTVLTWAVDMASLGGAIGFGYTSLAARRFAKEEGRKDIVIFGTLGFIFSVFFAILLLLPIPVLDCSLGWQSWLCLALWSILGTVFFLKTQLKPSKTREELDALVEEELERENNYLR